MTPRHVHLAEVIATIVGLACVAFAGVQLYREPALTALTDAAMSATHALHFKAYLALGGFGLMLIVPAQIAGAIRTVGASALEQWRVYQASKKASDTPGGGGTP